MRDNERTIMASLQREAERAPLMDAPPPEVVRRVKRRRTARAGLFAVSVGAVVGVVAAALVALSPLGDRRSFVGDDPTPSPSSADVTVLGSGVDPIAGPWTLRASFDQGRPTVLLDAENGSGGFSSGPMEEQIFGGYGAGGHMIAPDRYTFDVVGVVSAKAARVTLILVGGTEVEASALLPIPSRYFGDAQAYLIFGASVIPGPRHPGRTLTAYDEEGTVLDTQSLSGPDEPGGTSPEVDAVITQLREVRDVLSRSRGVEPFADFDLAKVKARLPEIPLNTSDSVVPGEVSVRVMDVRHAVLVTTAPEAPVMCLSIERDANPDGGWNFYYGLLDAPTFDACRGGWAPYTLPPT